MVKNLPLPEDDSTDFELIKKTFKEIKTHDFDIEKDIVSVSRKGSVAGYSGIVMVEMATESAKGKIMKNKKILTTHSNPVLSSLIIKNMKDRKELKMDTAFRDMLKLIPNGEKYFIATSGHIKEKKSYHL